VCSTTHLTPAWLWQVAQQQVCVSPPAQCQSPAGTRSCRRAPWSVCLNTPVTPPGQPCCAAPSVLHTLMPQRYCPVYSPLPRAAWAQPPPPPSFLPPHTDSGSFDAALKQYWAQRASSGAKVPAPMKFCGVPVDPYAFWREVWAWGGPDEINKSKVSELSSHASWGAWGAGCTLDCIRPGRCNRVKTLMVIMRHNEGQRIGGACHTGGRGASAAAIRHTVLVRLACV